jgi:hypothetical protein
MSTLTRILKGVQAAGACGLICGAAQGAPIDWNTWTSATGGTITSDSVDVVFAIAGSGSVDNLVPNYPTYTPTTTFADGSVVNNAPFKADGIIQLVGGNTNVNTVTFSKPVVNPVMAIWSLGAGGHQAQFDFTNATPMFVAGGPSAEYGGSAITISGNNVLGVEGNGTVQFIGTFTSLTWTNPVAENWYGFDVGIAGVGGGGSGVPEPSTFALLTLALVPFAVSLWRRGRRYTPAGQVA